MAGTTEVRVVGALPDRDAAELPERFLHLVGADGLPGWPDGFGETPARVGRDCAGEALLRPESRSLTPAGVRFADFVRAASQEHPATEAMRDASPALLADHPFAASRTVEARGAGPVAALHYALGAAAAALLPGWFGDFLLTADEVRAALPDAARALDLDGERRDRVLDRITAWTTCAGDDPDDPDDPDARYAAAGELLDGPLRVLRHAADTGMGAFACTYWR
ncbi:hypothetical protein [Kitasatospora sp. NPDC057198]|uniref:hypothetical protein n=1 Tax=Kitasatospora sp. NPDC057198 TaxID=3346046 RepID=UPI003632685F